MSAQFADCPRHVWLIWGMYHFIFLLKNGWKLFRSTMYFHYALRPLRITLPLLISRLTRQRRHGHVGEVHAVAAL